ncbi:MAG: amidoligase family protein [Rhodobacteraceae bacterium]|nr:amidoligase family protein [Paracoccaceae bacterium]
MDFLGEAASPPRQHTSAGDLRRVGVEVEFATVTAAQGADVVRNLFGGQIRIEDAHRYHVEGTRFGSFTSELDSRFAHRPKEAMHLEPAGESERMEGIRTELRRLFGEISSLVMPCEIICPPIPHDGLAQLDALVWALEAAGAEGTRASPFYAFGTQLNVEIADDDPVWLAAMFKAYLLVSPWLRAVMGIDLTRRAVSFADPFPEAYVHRVLDPGYRPGINDLIDDYLAANPTRNRELDMLPLFAWLDEDRVRTRTDDPRISARPAFHYRLPDANIGEPGWSLCLEWNRWLVVERLAEDRDLLDRMARDYLERAESGQGKVWPMALSQWLILA